jgi:hypothetical protein
MPPVKESEKPKEISKEDFEKFGYLQEVNRSFLHPLGLFLTYDEEGVARIFDYREDPDGVFFSDDYILGETALRKAALIVAEREKRRPQREKLLNGRVVQQLIREI